MSYTLKNNAYHILGLDTSASEKDIAKRSKEIINRLRADDVPVYDTDIGLFEDFRTEDAVKDALQRLQSPKKRIKEYFFWLQMADGIDEQAFGLLKLKDYLNAIRTWQNAAKTQSSKAFFYKKNLALLYCLGLSVENDKDYLQSSLLAWKELVDSDKFWAYFSKVYKLHDEQTASEDVISDFRAHVVEYLSDIYTELHHIHKNSDYVNEFQKVFSVKGAKVEKSILAPAYQAINEAVQKLEEMKVSADGVLDNQEKQTIKELIALIRTELNKLIDLGLYDDSQTKIIRDRAASALRGLSLDIHNNLHEIEIALELSKIADKISGTESFKNVVQQDIKTLQQNKEHKTKEEKQKSVVDPIIADFRSGNTDRALQKINQYIYNDSTDQELKDTLIEIKKAIEERVVKNGKPVAKAPAMQSFNGFGTTIYGDTVYIILLFVPVFALGRYKVVHNGGRSYSFLGKLELLKWQKIYNWAAIPAIIIIWAIVASSGN